MTLKYYIEPTFLDKVEIMGTDGKMRTVSTDLHFLSQLFRKIKKGFSPTVGICGNQRIGKSFVALWLCRFMMQMMGKEFNPEELTFYEPIKAIENLDNRSREALFVDEASDVLDPREWYDQTHLALKSMINTQANKNMLYVFVSPFIIDIDKAISKHFDFLIRVDDRGKFKTFRFLKKFDELNPNKVIRKIFLDDCDIRKAEVPKRIWDRYEKYSFEEKDNIRNRRIEKVKMKGKNKNIPDDPILRLKKLINKRL